jgi:hypothetical protein
VDPCVRDCLTSRRWDVVKVGVRMMVVLYIVITVIQTGGSMWGCFARASGDGPVF